VLTHGAGSTCDTALLTHVAEAFAEAGVTALRCDLPFRQRRARGGPGCGDAERDRRGLRNALERTRTLVSNRLFLGGHSYGGRQASLLVAENGGVADALLLLAYPLHPPGRPTQQRTEHLSRLRVPTLFVHGSRDPFGSLIEIEHARRLVPGPTALLAVDGADHALRVARRLPSLSPGEIVLAFLDLARAGS
jgi:predicted alpha/beta-hydrolase family hydrolase